MEKRAGETEERPETEVTLMALITKMDKVNPPDTMFRPRDPVKCEYSIREDSAGRRFLQINTYAAIEAQTDGVKQTMQFSPEAIDELREILTGL